MDLRRVFEPDSSKTSWLRRTIAWTVLGLATTWIGIHWDAINGPAEFGDGFWGPLIGISAVVTPLRVSVIVAIGYLLTSLLIHSIEGRPLKKVGQSEAETAETGQALEATSEGGQGLNERVSDLETALDVASRGVEALNEEVVGLDARTARADEEIATRMEQVETSLDALGKGQSEIKAILDRLVSDGREVKLPEDQDQEQ